MTAEPHGILDEATVIMHELLESYIRAGFTRPEALELVKVHLTDYLADTE